MTRLQVNKTTTVKNTPLPNKSANVTHFACENIAAGLSCEQVNDRCENSTLYRCDLNAVFVSCGMEDINVATTIKVSVENINVATTNFYSRLHIQAFHEIHMKDNFK